MKTKFTILFFALIFASNFLISQNCNVSISVSDNGNGTSVLTANGSGVDAPDYTWTDGSVGNQITVNNDGAQYCVTMSGTYQDVDENGDPISVPCSYDDCANAPTTAADCSSIYVYLSQDPNDANSLIATTNGELPVSFNWNPNTSSTETILLDGVTTYYTVDITDNNGCTASDGINVSTNLCANTDVIVSEDPNDPSQILAEATGEAPFSYAWSNGAPDSPSATLDGVTTYYSVTITDANGCTATNGVNVSTTPCTTTDVTLTEDPTSPGLITANATGDAPFVYTWNTIGVGAETLQADGVNTYYEVTITDAMGCEATDAINIGNNICTNTDVTLSEDPNDPTILVAEATGEAPFSYTWTPTSPDASTTVTDGSTIYYEVSITDANGCQATNGIHVSTTPCAYTSVTLSINETDPTLLDANAEGKAPFSYNWSPTAPDAPSITTDGTTTSYAVTITDADGCTASDAYNMDYTPCQNTDVSLAQNTNDPTILEATATGDAPFSYSWTPVAPDSYSVQLDGSSIYYEVEITDASGCKATKSININDDGLSSQLIIYNHIQDNSSFADDIVIFDETFGNVYKTTQQQVDPTKICADGSEATIIKYIATSTENPTDITFRTKSEILNGVNNTNYGYFTTPVINQNTITVSFHHPEVMLLNTNRFREDSFVVINSSNNKRVKVLPVNIYRAPVLFVHGLNADPGSFTLMSSGLVSDFISESVLLRSANYKASNVSHYSDNKNVVPDEINKLLMSARDNNFSAGKVIVVGHSMGGLLTRQYIQSETDPGYKGDIQKLITINTPHSGSQFGNLTTYPETGPLSCAPNGIRASWAVQKVFSKGFSTGAFEDLAVGSTALNSLNDPASAHHANYNNIACHAITSSVSWNLTCSVLKQILNINVSNCGFDETTNPFVAHLFNGDANDGIVPLTSQYGGLSGGQATLLNVGACHVGVTAETECIAKVEDLILSDPNDNSIFSHTGYNPTIITSPYKLVNTPSTEESSYSVTQSGNITITSPTYASNVNPGDVITINYTASSPVSKLYFQGIDTQENYNEQTNTNLNSSFTYTIPTNASGRIGLGVIGYDVNNSYVGYDTLMLHVNLPSTSIDWFDFYDDTIYVGTKNYYVLDMFVDYINGDSYDIGEWDGVTYTIADPSKLSYEGDDILRGKVVGRTTLTAVFNGQIANIPVIIYPCDTSLIDNTSATVGIKEIKNNSIKNTVTPSAKVFPNPNNGSFNIECDVLQGGNINIQLFDFKGSLVLSQTQKAVTNKFQTSIKTPDLPKGIYLLKTTDGQKQYINKVVIQ